MPVSWSRVQVNRNTLTVGVSVEREDSELLLFANEREPAFQFLREIKLGNSHLHGLTPDLLRFRDLRGGVFLAFMEGSSPKDTTLSDSHGSQ